MPAKVPQRRRRHMSTRVRKNEQTPVKNTYAACPRHWIGFGNKCFHFSESTSNWTFSQTSCVAQEAQLARFDNLEELVAPKVVILLEWFPIRGKENHAYLNNNRISSARVYVDKRWICSKPNSYTLQC
ncbi:C-type lectin domain family 2 member D-like [Meriones unguiculatus]|uniref:C-type lectin domain family 2 member D-like n=1 Tax=Meriones unguiculatus TaxID=10047 RepID=UPI00293E3E8E|nr:C-type lectin domain family 2 member D-like [Meriones unguiculatus]